MNREEVGNTIRKLNIGIKSWYLGEYPDDDVGNTLSSNVTFLDLNNSLYSKRGRDIYDLLGGDADSLIRERVFAKLAELKDVDYNEIYTQWLSDDEIVYDADIGSIVKVNDSESEFNNRLMYEAGSTLNGYCYKDHKTFKNNPDEVCYIAECEFDENLFVDYVNENKEEMIKEGGLSTANSIKEEIKNCLMQDEYYYEYQNNNVVYTIEAKNFDKQLIDEIAEIVFDIVDWQCTSSFIYETDWSDNIASYYEKKLKDKGMKTIDGMDTSFYRFEDIYNELKDKKIGDLTMGDIAKYLLVAEELDLVDCNIGDDKIFYIYDEQLLEKLSRQFEDSIAKLMDEDILYYNNLHIAPELDNLEV